ncbi:MAG: transglutaminase domain-containing protein [Bacteroidales bacterium]|nr:transglutaminase domain-containing protein [Bacteroidales bacterium]
MRKLRTTIWLAILLLINLITSAQEKHLISDHSYRNIVHNQFLKSKELAKGRANILFGVFNNPISLEQKEALEFLYAFMPLSDLAMHNGNYVLSQVNTALQAREFFSWGKSIPEEIFRHFVLPYRINNEYTDTSRQVFYKEIKDRIKGLSMYEAALEVNHWCHEKVTYKASDDRTSGPLTTVRNALGRCGEESTFTVAALRSVCLPARQVYTPRWAHTDDNHAWVEIWVDGKWYFLGACEPEPEPNMGWFAAPVKRAMMTHTVVFGQYQGFEEKLQVEDKYTRINLLANYTQTRTIPVKVLKTDGKSAAFAKVEFMLYNYAEFYPIATKYSDRKGICSAISGYGDLIIWASHNGFYGYQKVSGNSTDTIIVVLTPPNYKSFVEQYDLVPPVTQSIPVTDANKAAINNQCLQNEDLIRNKYISTFIDSASIINLAKQKEFHYNQIATSLKNSRGNWREIYTFINSLDLKDTTDGFTILRNISEKDTHDALASTLNDHLKSLSTFPVIDNTISKENIERDIISPRIGQEFITPWRSFLQKSFSKKDIEEFRKDPTTLVKWISQTIKTDTLSNYYNVPLNPESVFEMKVADRYSRDIFFVASCRSFGIPARIESATRKPQYLQNNKWVDVLFEKQVTVELPKGEVILTNQSSDKNFIPQYYTHFTIARLDKGQFTTLDYETDPNLKTFPCKLNLETGYYRLMTGNRLNNGSVKCRIEYFTVEKDKKVEIPIIVLPIETQTGVLGKADLDAGFNSLDGKSEFILKSYLGKKGLVVAVIDPDKEPTKHLMEDIQLVKSGFEQWGGQILFIVAKDKLSKDFNSSIYKNIPKISTFGYDPTGDVTDAIDLMCGKNTGTQYPQVSVINANGEIIFYSEGYSIGMGETILKNLSNK